jgi:hypothetical protein
LKNCGLVEEEGLRDKRGKNGREWKKLNGF